MSSRGSAQPKRAGSTVLWLLGVPPGPQAIPALIVAGWLVAALLDRYIGFAEPSKLADYLSLASTLVLGYPGFLLLRELYDRSQHVHAAGTLADASQRARDAARHSEARATRIPATPQPTSPPEHGNTPELDPGPAHGQNAPAEALVGDLGAAVDERRSRSDDHSWFAVATAYVGFVLMIAAAIGTIWPGAVPGCH